MPGRRTSPPLDEHVVQPETTRDEIVRGRRVIAQPALPPHGDHHCELDFVVRGHSRPGFISSTDLLTRIATESNFATDTCVRRAGLNVDTGQRWLEELAFEVVHTQSLADIAERAEDITNCGVRRVFAIFVKEEAVKEWSPDARAFRALNLEDAIDDACLSRPIPVRALLNAAEADNAVARALLAKNNPVLTEVGAAREAAGKAAGKAEAILTVLTTRGVAVGDGFRAILFACTDVDQLDAWLVRAVNASSTDEVLAHH